MRYSNGALILLVSVFAAAIFVSVPPPTTTTTTSAANTPTGDLQEEEKLDDAVDAGILSSPGAADTASDVLSTGSNENTAITTACTAGYIYCVNGNAVDGATGIETGSTCDVACGGSSSSCCFGDRACKGFTGKVCNDGSCNDKMACYSATIDSVVNSCRGKFSCISAGSFGSIGAVVNSCHAAQSCNALGIRGSAGMLQDSCNAYKSCWQVAFSPGSSIGNMTSSCNAEMACYKTAKNASITSHMNNCCNAVSECSSATESTLSVQCAGE